MPSSGQVKVADDGLNIYYRNNGHGYRRRVKEIDNMEFSVK